MKLEQHEVVRMAREAGLRQWWDSGNEDWNGFIEQLERFAALVAEAERKHIESNQDLTIAHMVGFEKGKDYMKEKAAQVCDAEFEMLHKYGRKVEAVAALNCAAAIRSMK